MTEPLVPPYVDLRKFPYMPLDVSRLRDSDVVTHTSAEGFRCAVLLWCASWHQVPAGSLPNNEKSLAGFAGFGRVPREWKKHRADALYGWVECTDGRLYHPVVAEKALEAWTERLKAMHRTECNRIKKAAQRNDFQPIYPSFEDWRAHFEATGDEHWCPPSVPGAVPGDKGGVSPGRPHGSGVQQNRTEQKGSITQEGSTHAEGSRTAGASDTHPAPEPAQAKTEAGRACLLMRQAGCATTNPSHPDLLAALDEGVTPEALADTVTEALTKTPPIAKPFAWAISTARSRHAAGAASPTNGETHGADSRGAAPRRESLSDRTKRLNAEHDARESDPGF